MAVLEVTRGEFERSVEDTGYPCKHCLLGRDDAWGRALHRRYQGVAGTDAIQGAPRIARS